MMTKTQLRKAMASAGVTGEIRGSGPTLEVELVSEEAVTLFTTKVAPWGGYTTGYGAVVLQQNYVDKGDWNDPSSRWHY